MRRHLTGTWLNLAVSAVIAAAIGATIYASANLREIETSLPVESIALERDVFVYYIDLDRLRDAVESYLLSGDRTTPPELMEALDFAVIRNRDLANLPDRTREPVFLDLHVRIGDVLARIDAIVAETNPQPALARLEAALEDLSTLTRALRAASDIVTQDSMYTLTRQAGEISDLQRSTIAMLAFLGVATIVLISLLVVLGRAQADLERSRAALADKVAALQSAREEAETANRAKSEFLASVSHELRTPLNAVMGFAQLMEVRKDEPLTDRQTEAVGAILGAGRHLLNLINEILDLARIESAAFRFDVAPLDLETELRETVTLIQPLADDAGVRTEFRCGLPAGFRFDADPVRLRQIVLNLLSNAVKHNVAGGRVTLEAVPTAEGGVRITVEDTGIGIAPEDHERVFELFHRVHDAGSTVAREGAGIGLSVCKSLVERMGGRITLRSAVGRGAAFDIILPPGASASLASSSAPGMT